METVLDLKVFARHLYEYKKGLRRLVLYTAKAEYKGLIAEKLKRRDIPYIIQRVSIKKINVFFGKQYCIDVLNSFRRIKILSSVPCLDTI